MFGGVRTFFNSDILIISSYFFSNIPRTRMYGKEIRKSTIEIIGFPYFNKMIPSPQSPNTVLRTSDINFITTCKRIQIDGANQFMLVVTNIKSCGNMLSNNSITFFKKAIVELILQSKFTGQ